MTVINTIEGDADDSSDIQVSEWSFVSNSSHMKANLGTQLHNILVDKVFIGEYVERHYVDSLATYRDLLVISLNDEVVKSLEICMNFVRTACPDKKWLGITTGSYDGTPAGYCLWVELSQIPLGKHWFKIDSMKYTSNEIALKINHLRAIKQNEDAAKSTPPEAPTSTTSDFLEDFDVQKFFQELQWSDIRKRSVIILLNMATWCYTNAEAVLTYENIKEAVKFSSILIFALFSFIFEAAHYLCDYSLKMMHEMAKVIRALTPIVLGIIEFFSKCVGGFYLLIIMLWRGSSGSPIPANALPAAFRTNEGWSTQRSIKHGSNYGPDNIYINSRPQPRGRFSQY